MAGFVLGAGVTGLSAGMASGFPVLEQAERPGGICTSYYMRANAPGRLAERPAADDAFQFENGGGHWIFGGDDDTLRFISSLTPLSSHERRAAVYFPDDGRMVPYPLQAHLSALGPDAQSRMLAETSRERAIHTMRDWLEASFGESLCRQFFFPVP